MVCNDGTRGLMTAGALAERGGFEPPEPFDSSAFKAGAFVRSATVPPTNLPAVSGMDDRNSRHLFIFNGRSSLSAWGADPSPDEARRVDTRQRDAYVRHPRE